MLKIRWMEPIPCSFRFRRLVLLSVVSTAVVLYLYQLSTRGAQFREPLEMVYTHTNPVEDPTKAMHLLYRRSLTVRTEYITTANTFPHPRNNDFGIFVDYGNQNITIFEDYGPGCVVHIFAQEHDLEKEIKVRPSLPAKIVFEMDGTVLEVSYMSLYLADDWPFISPISSPRGSYVNGISLFYPLCYNRHVRVTHVHHVPLPAKIREDTTTCSSALEWYACPLKFYMDASFVKFPLGESVETFSTNSMRQRLSTERLARAMALPQVTLQYACRMLCTSLMADDRGSTVYRATGPGVLTRLLLRIMSLTGGNTSPWYSLFMSVWYDDELRPSFEAISLALLFGSSRAYVREVKGAAVGLLVLPCSYQRSSDSFPEMMLTGYITFPMPFKKSIRIELSNRHSFPVVACIHTEVGSLTWEMGTIAYLHAEPRFYLNDLTDTTKSILSLEDHWGSLVATFVEIHNGTPDDEETDPIIYLDGAPSPQIHASSLEDYFSCSHHCNGGGGRTSAYVGTVYAEGTSWTPGPYSRQYYRLHLLDPVVFFSSATFLLEGISANRSIIQPSTSLDDYLQAQVTKPKMSTAVLYYSGKGARMSQVDQLELGSAGSASAHRLLLNGGVGGSTWVNVTGAYWSDIHQRAYTTKTALCLVQGSAISFSMSLPRSPFVALLLRRELYTPPLLWNQAATVSLNQRAVVRWQALLPAMSNTHTFRSRELLISRDLVSGPDISVMFQITAESTWCDVRYTLLAVT